MVEENIGGVEASVTGDTADLRRELEASIASMKKVAVVFSSAGKEAEKALEGIGEEIKENVTDATKEADESSSKFFTNFKRGLAALGVGLAFRTVLQSTIEAENSFKLLEQRIQATGGAAGRTAPQLAQMASELQELTTFSDDAIMSAQTMLLSFDKIQGPVFDRALKSTLDLAAGLGVDLQNAVQQVGVALGSPVEGMTRLRRAGITFTDEQENVIKGLVGVGRVADAQKIILNRLEGAYKGAAAAAKNTLGGAFSGLKNAAGDLLEDKGLTDVTVAVNELTKALQDPGVKEGLATLTSGMIKLVELAVKGASAFSKFGKAIGEFAGSFVVGLSLEEQVAALQEMRQRVAQLTKEFPEMVRKGGLDGLNNQIKVLEERLRPFAASFQFVKDALDGVSTATVEAASGITKIKAAQDEALPVFNQYQDKVDEIVKSLQEQLDKLRLTEEQFIRNKLASLGATEAEKDRAAAIVDSIKVAQEQLAFEEELKQRHDEIFNEERELRIENLKAIPRAIREEIGIEQELLSERLEQLAAAREEELITLEEFLLLKEEMEAEHAERVKAIREAGLTDLEKFTALSFGKQAEIISKQLVDMTAGVAQHSRAMFEVNKIAGIANALIKAKESIVNAYAFGSRFGGPIAGAAAAAIAAGAVFAQVSAIRSQTFSGSGGAAPSLAGGTPAPPTSPVDGGGGERGGPTTIIQLQGDTFGEKQVRALLEKVNEGLANGGRIVIA